MVKSIAYRSNEKSVYECDMCGKKLYLDETFKIHVNSKQERKKLFDLCQTCYNKLTRSVISYRSKKINKK